MNIFEKILIVISLATSLQGIQHFDDVMCENQLNSLDMALEKRELWALNMLDTWGKIPSGLLHGNTQSPGHFTECVETRYNKIQGQHCMTTVSAMEATANGNDNRPNWSNAGLLIRDNKLTLTVGICLPASCSPLRVVSYSNKFLIESDLKAISTFCRTNDPVLFEAIDYFALVVFGLLLIMLVASTIYDVVLLNAGKSPNKLLTAFSIYTNGAKLFEMNKIDSPNVINCLDGIKTLSIFWIIFGHRFVDDLEYGPIFNDATSCYKNYIYLLFTNYNKPVDTFFLIGGLLGKKFHRKNVNILRMYLHRYLRYTPSLALVILFHVSFTKFLGSGPFFDTKTGDCEKYWWSALLHLTVYTNPLHPCYGVSWYLAVDFQLFVISPLLIYTIWKWGKRAFWILPVIVFLVQGCIFTVSYTKNINVYYFSDAAIEEISAWIEHFYLPTHLRVGAWVIGIALGYIMHHTKEKKFKINRFVDAALWILSIGVLLTILICHYPFIQLDNKTSKVANALYNSSFRIGWSFSVAWIIFACQNGSGGVIRWFLSWKEWQPFGRLGLSIYLVHNLYQIITIINQKQPLVWDFFTEIQKFFGDVLISFFIGTLLYLTIETPVRLIECYLHDKFKGVHSLSRKKLY